MDMDKQADDNISRLRPSVIYAAGQASQDWLSRIFLGFFSLQFMLAPQFLTDTNFKDGRKLDQFHLFVMCGFGVLGSGFLGA